MKKAVLLISHGSHSPIAKMEIAELAKVLKERSGISIFIYAFLDVNHPTIPEGIKQCVDKGAEEIIVLYNFLNSGKHVLDDISSLIREAERKYPQVVFRITPPIGQHPRIPDLFMETLRKTSK